LEASVERQSTNNCSDDAAKTRTKMKMPIAN
jgi:hypothetical protein